MRRRCVSRYGCSTRGKRSGSFITTRRRRCAIVPRRGSERLAGRLLTGRGAMRRAGSTPALSAWYIRGRDAPMLFAVPCRGHEPHEFVAGECHRCGRLLEVALGAAVETLQDPGMVRLRGAITQTRAEWDAEADRLGLTRAEYLRQNPKPRLGDPSCARRPRVSSRIERKPRRAFRFRACTERGRGFARRAEVRSGGWRARRETSSRLMSAVP